MKRINILGLVVLFAGLISLIGFGFYGFFKDTGTPLLVRGGVLLIIGLTILLTSLILERLKESN